MLNGLMSFPLSDSYFPRADFEIPVASASKVKPWFSCGVHKMAANLLDALRVECYSPPLPVQHDGIHVANGTYFLDGHFEENKDFCINRLPVPYRPEAPAPKVWLQFLSDLLIPEDIQTLQEFMGYCLIPSTKAQKMQLMVGKGGEKNPELGLSCAPFSAAI